MTAAEIARYAVAKAVWAPSVHNTQPWRFTVGTSQISLYADANRRLLVADPNGRETLISCGAALFDLRLALRSLGFTPQTYVLPDPGQPSLVARVSWRPGVADEFERRGCNSNQPVSWTALRFAQTSCQQRRPRDRQMSVLELSRWQFGITAVYHFIFVPLTLSLS